MYKTIKAPLFFKVSKINKIWLIENHFSFWNYINEEKYGPFEGFETGKYNCYEIGQLMGGN